MKNAEGGQERCEAYYRERQLRDCRCANCSGFIGAAGWVPPNDSTLVKKLRAAGAIVIAKSNMHEFAYGIANVAHCLA